jgi:hypothetical protein
MVVIVSWFDMAARGCTVRPTFYRFTNLAPRFVGIFAGRAAHASGKAHAFTPMYAVEQNFERDDGILALQYGHPACATEEIT